MVIGIGKAGVTDADVQGSYSATKAHIAGAVAGHDGMLKVYIGKAFNSLICQACFRFAAVASRFIAHMRTEENGIYPAAGIADLIQHVGVDAIEIFKGI